MKIIGKEDVKRVVYTIDEVDGYNNITYIEYIDRKNKVIDEELRDEDGYSIHDPALLEKVQNMVDSLQ